MSEISCTGQGHTNDDLIWCEERGARATDVSELKINEWTHQDGHQRVEVDRDAAQRLKPA